MDSRLSTWRDRLHKAAELELEPRYVRPPPAPAEGRRASAVLVLTGLCAAGDPALLLIRRSEGLAHHPGQYGFPGGMLKPGETAVDAALRETHEEVALKPDAIEICGSLPEFSTANAAWRIQPLVALLAVPRDQVTLVPDPAEVAEAFWVPWAELMDPGNFREETFERAGLRYVLPAYHLLERRIWGATALMIHHFLERSATLRA